MINHGTRLEFYWRQARRGRAAKPGPLKELSVGRVIKDDSNEKISLVVRENSAWLVWPGYMENHPLYGGRYPCIAIL